MGQTLAAHALSLRKCAQEPQEQALETLNRDKGNKTGAGLGLSAKSIRRIKAGNNWLNVEAAPGRRGRQDLCELKVNLIYTVEFQASQDKQ